MHRIPLELIVESQILKSGVGCISFVLNLLHLTGQ
jgi:hypothetical protein